jgi:hypothetical protein
MAATVRDTIKEITRKHLTEGKGKCYGQCLTAVGCVGGTLTELYEDGGMVMSPVRDWLRKHNQLNEQINRTFKVEPMMKFQKGGFVPSFVEAEQPIRLQNGGFLENFGTFVNTLAAIRNLDRPQGFEDGGVVNPFLNFLNTASLAGNLLNATSDSNSPIRKGIEELVKLRQRRK